MERTMVRIGNRVFRSTIVMQFELEDKTVMVWIELRDGKWERADIDFHSKEEAARALAGLMEQMN